MASDYNFRTCGMSSDRAARYRLALLKPTYARASRMHARLNINRRKNVHANSKGGCVGNPGKTKASVIGAEK